MYIIKFSDEAFLKNRNHDIIITSDYTKAEVFEKIGDAMKVAGSINKKLRITASIIKI